MQKAALIPYFYLCLPWLLYCGGKDEFVAVLANQTNRLYDPYVPLDLSNIKTFTVISMSAQHQ